MADRTLIIGAGPTGLGAAWRLHELGHTDWHLVEAEDHAGGLASSFTDDQGFTWDNGGHVIFSHYDYFDRLMDRLLGRDWYHHERESWVWMMDRWVPYPFQNNIRHLPPEALWDCIEGLLRRPANDERPADFESFIHHCFGKGIADHFLMPYNFKVWAIPPREMNSVWVGERVAPVDLERVLRNVILQRDEVSWGPNNTFRFPAKGGTGQIWRLMARALPSDRLTFGTRLESIDTERRVATFSDGTEREYDHLISTMPLPLLVRLSDREDLLASARDLRHCSTHIIGIGLKGAPSDALKTKCWMYFPEDNAPFYRVTVFSHYSPDHVPDINTQWSLMAEVSESAHRPVDEERIIDETIQGMLNTKLIDSPDQVIDVYHRRLEYGYPVPSLHRDQALGTILPALERVGIHSRGRFGAWKYEVANQDHSLMQGVEIAERITLGKEEQTLPDPDFVNGGGAKTRSVEE